MENDIQPIAAVPDLVRLSESEIAALSEGELASTLQTLDARRRDARAELERLEQAVDRLERELAERGCGG
jgi:hypothetical protein